MKSDFFLSANQILTKVNINSQQSTVHSSISCSRFTCWLLTVDQWCWLWSKFNLLTKKGQILSIHTVYTSGTGVFVVFWKTMLLVLAWVRTVVLSEGGERRVWEFISAVGWSNCFPWVVGEWCCWTFARVFLCMQCNEGGVWCCFRSVVKKLLELVGSWSDFWM
jgi:hypothetical protein